MRDVMNKQDQALGYLSDSAAIDSDIVAIGHWSFFLITNNRLMWAISFHHSPISESQGWTVLHNAFFPHLQCPRTAEACSYHKSAPCVCVRAHESILTTWWGDENMRSSLHTLRAVKRLLWRALSCYPHSLFSTWCHRIKDGYTEAKWNTRCRWHDPFGRTSYRVSCSEESGEQSDVTAAAEDFHTDH